LKDFLKGERAIEYQPGHILVRQGEASGEAFLLESGSVQIFAETAYCTVPLASGRRTVSLPEDFRSIKRFP
jgi:hypothetical protein